MDIEGVYELKETILALHQVGSSCRVLDCIVPTTLSPIAWGTEARTLTKFRGRIHTLRFASRPNALLLVPYLQSSCRSELLSKTAPVVLLWREPAALYYVSTGLMQVE